MMTNQEKQQLSRDVAAKYAIEPYFVMPATLTRTEVWLHEDSARCFDFMLEHDIYLAFIDEAVFSYSNTIQGYFSIRYTDHNHDKQEATRIAILKALLAKGE